MQQLEEKDSSPLEDAEITRLIKVSRELGYKKQDKIPERNLVDFKPTSITQIAASSDDQKDNQSKESINGSENTDLAENIHNENVIENKEVLDEEISAQNPVDSEPNSQNTIEQREKSVPLDDSLTSTSEPLEPPAALDTTLGNNISNEQAPETGLVKDIPAQKDTVKETTIASTRDQSSKLEELFVNLIG